MQYENYNLRTRGDRLPSVIVSDTDIQRTKGDRTQRAQNVREPHLTNGLNGMPKCEDCGNEQKRRVRCYHCGLLICSWCWHYIHCCEPSHTKDKCIQYNMYKKHGLSFLKRVRKVVLARKECKRTSSNQRFDLSIAGQPHVVF